MKNFQIDVKIAGTVYVKAETEEEALLLINKHFPSGSLQFLEVAEDRGAPNNDPDNIYVSGLPFDHPELPIVSISPVMTIHGPWFHDHVVLYEVAE